MSYPFYISTAADGVLAFWVQCYDILGNPVPWLSNVENHPKSEMIYNHTEQLAGVLNVYNYGLAGEQPNLTLQVAFFKDGEKRGQTEDGPFMAMSSEMALTVVTNGVNIAVIGAHGYFSASTGLADESHDLDHPLADFRNFQFKQVLDKPHVSS